MFKYNNLLGFLRSRSNELTKLPLAFIDLACFVDEFSVATPLAVKPVADVVVSVRVDKPPVTVVNIIHELTFVNDMVDFFSYSCDLAITSKLANDEFVLLALAEWEGLVDRDLGVSDNIVKS